MEHSIIRTAIAVLTLAAGCFAGGATETTLHSFSGGTDGAYPDGNLLIDSSGVLYGTAAYGSGGYGNIFKLIPPATPGGSWTEGVVYKFAGGASGSLAVSGLTMGAQGALYGTARFTNGNKGGVVFKVSGQGAANYTVLYQFSGGTDGSDPICNLIFDNAGSLWGTTSVGGTFNKGVVFKLTGSGTTWTETVIYNFSGGLDGGNPLAGVVLSSSGALYGTTVQGGASNQGVVYKLTPGSGGAFTYSTLYSFTGGPDGGQPYAPVIINNVGALLGTTFYGGSATGKAGDGVVFKLTPPTGAGVWTESVLHTFTGADGDNPNAGLTFDTTTGAVYGTTTGVNGGFGNLFKLIPPVTPGGSWTEQVLYSFTGGTDGEGPLAAVTLTSGGTIYSTTYYGGTYNRGTVFQLTQ